MAEHPPENPISPPAPVTPTLSPRRTIIFPPGLLMGLGFTAIFLVLKFSPVISVIWGVVGGIASRWIEGSWSDRENLDEEMHSLPTDFKAEENSLAQNRTRGEQWQKRGG